MKKHYVCTGECGGVNENPGVCHSEGCTDYNVPLKECGCEDGRHAEAFLKANEDLLDIEDDVEDNNL